MARENYKVAPNVNVESDNLLRIIHDGIDNIIVKLKQAVDLKGYGTNGTIEKTNDAVVKILKVFNDFQSGFVPETGQMKERDGTTDLTPIIYGENKLVVESNTGLLMGNYVQSRTTLPAGTEEANILDLRTDIDYNTYIDDEKNITITNNNKYQLEQRLINCSHLEELYLRKHNEIIKIFGFVVNLFDKYKYAIKVILFLLKNLVRAGKEPPPPPGDVSVRLPKPLITNINLLLKDQANIQTIIDGMEKVVDDTDTAIAQNLDPGLNQSLYNPGTPPNLHNESTA